MRYNRLPTQMSSSLVAAFSASLIFCFIFILSFYLPSLFFFLTLFCPSPPLPSSLSLSLSLSLSSSFISLILSLPLLILTITSCRYPSISASLSSSTPGRPSTAESKVLWLQSTKNARAQLGTLFPHVIILMAMKIILDKRN